MSKKCPNKSSSLWKLMVSKVGERESYRIWMKNNEEIPSEEFINKLKVPGKKKQERIPFQTQYVYFKRQINRIERDLNRLSPNTDEFRYKENELNAAKERLANAINTLDREEFTKMGREQLQWVQNLIDSLPLNPDKRIVDNISTAFEILNTFKDWIGLKDDTGKLREKLFTYISNHNLTSINKAFASQGVNITNELLEENMLKDIRWSAKNWGSLSDSINYIVATIGRIISEAQNKAATANHTLKLAIQKEVDTLKEYASKNNTSLSDIYELMTQTVVREYNGKTTSMLVLAQQYLDGETNPNWTKIQNTPELKHFYDFYQSVLKAAESRLPYSVGKYYVLNKEKTDWKKDLKNSLPSVDNVLFDSFVSNEELLTDAIPDKYRYNIDPSKKSKDLGSGLLEFASYANNHAELNKALPETRLLQEQLKYQQNSDGTVTEREFIDNANPKKSIVGEKSNANQMVETVIDMQLKGKMKDNKTKGIIIGKIRDEEGNIIGNKEVHIEDYIDFGLRWNSLLRIGLSPITAITNVIFGDASNILEAVGGRYFTIGNLHSATNIFRKQIDYINRDRTSNLYKWLDKLNPLQELADYNLAESVQANRKKITKERVLELMYSPQAKGELYLQSRTMVAMLIKEGYMKSDGTNTPEGQKIIDGLDDIKANELTSKVQRVNQLVHGRYTQREAAALSQSVWFRMAMQFRKWIPAAIEGRFGDARFDTRLGIDVEGRYKSAWRNTFHSGSIGNTFENMFLPLIASKKLIDSGQMTETEVYNMRKNVTEAILLFGTLLLVAGLKSGDDDERRRKLRNPWIKAGLTGLNRLSGDLNFFYNPTNIKNMASNAVPMSKLIGDLITIGETLPHAFYLGDYEVKRGSLKNTNKFYSKDIWKVLPGGAPGGQVQRILNHTDILPELN